MEQQLCAACFPEALICVSFSGTELMIFFLCLQSVLHASVEGFEGCLGGGGNFRSSEALEGGGCHRCRKDEAEQIQLVIFMWFNISISM